MSKSFKILVAACPVLFSLICCEGNDSKQKVYCIGREYCKNHVTWKFDIDKDNNRFSYSIQKEDKTKTDSLYLSFYFFVEMPKDQIDVEKEFTFKGKNDELLSLHTTYYYDESTLIYIYFDNSSDIIKQAIESDNYSIEAMGKTYLPMSVIEKDIYSA